DGRLTALMSFLAVALLTVVVMRSLRDGAWVIASLALGVLWGAGAMTVLKLKLNFVNFAVLPITFGIGVDYAVNLYQRYRQTCSVEEALSSSGGAVALVGLPYLLYALVYDSMRWYADYIRSPIIHVHEPYEFDLRWFGIHGLTPNEWLQKHTSAVLDFLCGLAYTPMFFIGESILLSIWFIANGQVRRAERFTWIFVISNFIGFACYYVYPAAPPWYVSDHGFVVNLAVHASPAGAIRFDHLIGIPVMQGFYGKSADVFGAIPSLHVVYPFLAMIYGW